MVLGTEFLALSFVSMHDEGRTGCHNDKLYFLPLFSAVMKHGVLHHICTLNTERPPLWSSGQSSWLQNGEVLCFLWGTKLIYICYVESRPPLWSSGQSSWLHNRDVLCFLWGTNWIWICYVGESRPPLWSSGQSSWLHNLDVLGEVKKKVKVKLSCNRPWRPIGLWDVKDPTLSRQSAHRWWQGCHPYAPAALYSLETLLLF
jgi:hypothetical protein